MPAARLEIIDAYEWYRRRSPRAAEGFVAELERQLVRIAENPEALMLMLADVRRVRLRRYPYALFFRVVDERCYVLACLHGSRDPKVWRDRV